MGMHSLTLPSKRSTLEGLSCISQENFQFFLNYWLSQSIRLLGLLFKKTPKVQKSLKEEPKIETQCLTNMEQMFVGLLVQKKIA